MGTNEYKSYSKAYKKSMIFGVQSVISNYSGLSVLSADITRV